MKQPFAGLDFNRFVYRQGQLLASQDFRDQQRMEAARRWMHNTAVHHTWGVTGGYDFSLSPESADDIAENIWQENQTLTVQPGMAYDCFGRELILPRAVAFARDRLKTEAASRWVLLASYQESGAGENETLCKVSPNSTAVPVPRLQWQPENEASYGVEVPLLLASLDLNNELVVTRYATSRLHPQARPKMASGQTVPGLTAWRPWIIKIGSGSDSTQFTIGTEVDIDTSDAGFQQTPCYFVWLNGRLAQFIEIFSKPFPEAIPFAPFLHLINERPNGFTCRVFAPIFQSSFNDNQISEFDPTAANTYEVTICWLAIESQQINGHSTVEPKVIETSKE